MLSPQRDLLPPSADAELRAWREGAVAIVLRVMLLVGAIASVGMAQVAYRNDTLWLIACTIGAYVLLAAVTLWRRVPLTVRICVMLFVLYGTGVGALVFSGNAGIGLSILIAGTFLAGLLAGRRAAAVSAGLSIAVLLVVASLLAFGRRALTVGWAAGAGEPMDWVVMGLVYVALTLLVLLPGEHLQGRLVDGLRHGRRLLGEMAAERTGLQLQVAERTTQLELRAQYMEAITELTHSATALLDDPQKLLERVVDLITDRLAFHHTAVFLVDQDRVWLEMRAASSDEGRLMLRQGHRVALGEDGIIARVAARGVAQVAPGIGQRTTDPPSSYLASTRSELALPLRVRGETIGVLDVQSAEASAFSDDDVAVLQILADQLAVALTNARLSSQVRDSAEAMRRAYGEMGVEMWRSLLRAGEMSVRYDPDGALSDGSLCRMTYRAQRDAELAVEEGRPGAVAVPVKVRGGHVIGVVNAVKPRDQGAWKPEELELLRSLVDQLGVALDGARLYQESQQRAERERLVAEISARMRETLNIDAVLRTAIREIGETMGFAEVEVRMRAEEEAER